MGFPSLLEKISRVIERNNFIELRYPGKALGLTDILIASLSLHTYTISCPGLGENSDVPIYVCRIVGYIISFLLLFLYRTNSRLPKYYVSKLPVAAIRSNNPMFPTFP